MSSDRTQFKQVVAGSIGDSRTLSGTNPLAANGVVAQDAQRFEQVGFGPTAGSANTNYTFAMARLDRPVQIKEVRILPGAALTTNGNTVVQYGYTNDNGGSFTVMGSVNTNQNVSLGTGNWAALQSLVVAANASVNAVVPSGSMLAVKLVATAPSEAVPAGTAFQVIWEEV